MHMPMTTLKIALLWEHDLDGSTTKISRQFCGFLRSYIQIRPKIFIFIALLQYYAAYTPSYR